MATSPGLLVAEIFKGRYSRDSDILDATAKAGCSFVWRSIIGSKEVLETGSRWKVGNGEIIKVFGDRWVEGCRVDRLRGSKGRSDEQMRVKHLLREEGGWDEGVVNSLFDSFEREEILGTKCDERMRADWRWWDLEAKGVFTVKSCYLAQVGFYAKHNHTSSEDRKMWSKMVWQVSIPPKVRVFMWRACMNIIPTMGNLRDHHVPVEGECPLCRNRWATTEHMLIFCSKIRWIWKESGFWRIMKNGRMATFEDIARYVMREIEEEEYAVWCIMVWKMWSYVCEVLHGRRELEQVPRFAECRGLWEACQRAKGLVSREMHLGVSCGERRWRKPQRGIIRVDVDALYNEATNQFGVGVILRDSEGKVCGALSKKTARKANVMIAETMAVVEGIVFSMKCQVEMITVFTDSLLVARLMANEEEFEDLLPGDICDIIKKAREFLLVDVFHMYRSANRAAHSLAQRSSDFDSERIWIDRCPTWLREIVRDDVKGE